MGRSGGFASDGRARVPLRSNWTRVPYREPIRTHGTPNQSISPHESTMTTRIDSAEVSSTRIGRSGWLFWIALLLITLYAGALRLYKLDQYPQLVTQDEMIQAYDAWNIWQTGRDHTGVLFPIHVFANGENIPPVAVYYTAPFVGLLGLSEFTTRLPF